MFYTYEIFDLSNHTCIYVGSGQKERYKKHGTHNKNLSLYISKMTTEPFVLRTFAKTKQEANNLETKLIKEHGRRDLGTGTLFNKTDGQGMVNPSNETKFLHSEATKLAMAKPEIRQRFEEGMQNRKSQKGIPRSDETKQKIRLANIGSKKSDEDKEKMRMAALNRPSFTCIGCKCEFKHPKHFLKCN